MNKITYISYDKLSHTLIYEMDTPFTCATDNRSDFYAKLFFPVLPLTYTLFSFVSFWAC